MLITLDDLQSALNVDLTDPNGQTVATNLITAAQAEAEAILGFPLEARLVTTYFNGEDRHLWLPTAAPVSDVQIATYNASTNAYDTVDGQYVRSLGDARVTINTSLPEGPEMVRATYTTGWTADTLPADLKHALIELVGIKLLETANFSSTQTTTDVNGTVTTTTPEGAVKRVQSDSYSVEYSTAQADAYWKGQAAQLARSIGDTTPAGVMEVFRRYQPVVAI